MARKSGPATFWSTVTTSKSSRKCDLGEPDLGGEVPLRPVAY
jgi:hypothetical protein